MLYAQDSGASVFAVLDLYEETLQQRGQAPTIHPFNAAADRCLQLNDYEVRCAVAFLAKTAYSHRLTGADGARRPGTDRCARV